MGIYEGMGISEGEVIELLARVFATSDPRLLLGIGDDAAVVTGSSQQILTTDIAVDGVHFKSSWSSPYEIGARIAKANIADVLSMNGRCDYLLVAASLTGEESLDWIGQLAQGIADVAKEFGAIVVGGDLTKSPALQLAITAIGHTDNPITRSGAQIGDGIYLSSLTGWSAAGLELLSKGLSIDSDAAVEALAQYRNPTIDSMIDFSKAHAMADVSDSLLIQGEQIAKASEVALEIEILQIEKADEFVALNRLATETSSDIWQWILAGGEDHVLLATGQNLPGLRIGQVVTGSGISIKDPMSKIKVAPVSWSHFL
jgi:thiamine-monophosphate kinase